MTWLLAIAVGVGYLVGWFRGWCAGFNEGREHWAFWMRGSRR